MPKGSRVEGNFELRQVGLVIFGMSQVQQALFVDVGITAHGGRIQADTICFQRIDSQQVSYQLLLKGSIPLIIGQQTQHIRQSIIRHIQGGQVFQPTLPRVMSLRLAQSWTRFIRWSACDNT